MLSSLSVSDVAPPPLGTVPPELIFIHLVSGGSGFVFHLKAGAKLCAGGARSLLHRDVAVVAHGKDLA